MANLEGREVFQLHPLLYPALPEDPHVEYSSQAALNRAVRCAEPFESNLYLGSSDGQIHRFLQPIIDDTNGNTSSNDLRHVNSRQISSKGIDKIIILAKIRLAAVLSEATLTFYELPSFTPIPNQVLPHTKGVASVLLDDAEVEDGLRRLDGGVDAEGLCNLCIIKRKSLLLVKIGIDTWRSIKEIPLPLGATVARRFGSALCFATTTDYHMVNLDEAVMSHIGLPITQTGDTPSAANRPSIVSVSSQMSQQCEFIITSHSQTSTLGVFVSQKGEPTAKILEWPSHPRALAMEYPYLHALLRNDSIEVHNISTMSKVQIIQLPESLEPRLLSQATSDLELDEGVTNQVKKIRMRLARGGKRQRLDVATEAGTSIGRKSQSRVMMIGKNVVQHLSMSRPLVTARKALLRGDYERAREMVQMVLDEEDNASKDGKAGGDEVDYLVQMIALYYIKLLRFEEAKKFLVRSHLDVRISIHLFSSISDAIKNYDCEVQVFDEVAEMLDEIGNLDTFSKENLRFNYVPPLELEGDKMIFELDTLLRSRLDQFLHDLTGVYRSDERLMSDSTTRSLLDNLQARLLIVDNKGKELAMFLQHDNQCDMPLLEPLLYDMGCYAALVKIKMDQLDYTTSLELLTRLLDGELHDDTFNGTMADFIGILETCPDEGLVHKYSLWLVQRDAEAGIRLLTRDRSSNFQDQKSLLHELRGVDERAADGYLEYMALSRKQHTSEAHMELVHVLLDRIMASLQQEDDRSMMMKVTQDYIEGGFAESFVAHMALYCHQSVLILMRLKLIMLLQGSSLVDFASVLDRVMEDPMLLFEQAVLAGRLHRDEQALNIFAIQLRDANSAEIYCNQNRFALSFIQLQSLAQEQKELVLYSRFYSKIINKKVHRNEEKIKLLKVLLRVYMQRGALEGGLEVATSHLLNSQSLNLSISQVLEMVPKHWSLSALETFISRSLRKEMHQLHQGQIQRSIALAQNLEVAEALWAQRRNLGGVIEDGGDLIEGEMISGDELINGDGTGPIAVDLVGEKYNGEKDSIRSVPLGDE